MWTGQDRVPLCFTVPTRASSEQQGKLFSCYSFWENIQCAIMVLCALLCHSGEGLSWKSPANGWGCQKEVPETRRGQVVQLLASLLPDNFSSLFQNTLWLQNLMLHEIYKRCLPTTTYMPRRRTTPISEGNKTPTISNYVMVKAVTRISILLLRETM